MKIELIQNSYEKKDISRKILSELPNWFGIPESVDEYVEHSMEMQFWAAYCDSICVGFSVIKKTSSLTAEIYVMGVLETYHNRGIGHALFDNCYSWCKQSGFEFLQVKTLDKSQPDKYYANTRKFYEAIGFKELECIPEIWGKENPCLIMVMHIE